MNDLLHAMGWTLFHSLWQAPLMLLIVVTVLRLLSTRQSAARYGVACAGLLLFLVTSIATFIYFLNEESAGSFTYSSTISYAPAGQLIPSSDAIGISDLLTTVTNFVDQNLPVILILWAAGFALFSLRLAGSLSYTSRIRASATAVDNEWLTFIGRAAQEMGIRRPVALALSPAVSAPIVIGYLKPVILVPVGMFTGLTTEQLETVFLHELAHIKRHDYLVNICQSLLETTFFFNPFIWVLSGIIRTEREYCCDDMVIRYHGGSKAYAHALTRLAEARLAFAGFALSIANDKNQLLIRIKRIMERTVKTHAGRKGKYVIPALLLVGALACISWLGMETIDTDSSHRDVVSEADTIPDKKKESKGVASYSRRSIITLDENGQPHEEVVEEFEGDESLRPLLEQEFGAIPGAPSPGSSLLPPGIPGLNDTIPPAFGLRNNRDWEEFARSMQKRLQERFEMFDHFKHDSLFMQDFADRWQSFAIPDAMKALEKFNHGEAFKHMQEELDRLRDLDFERFEDFGKQFAPQRQDDQGYEKALRDQLLKDGYLNKDESIESLEWSDNAFKVNGKAIRKSDREKYKELNNRFFGGGE